jgi:hypothetical protein
LASAVAATWVAAALEAVAEALALCDVPTVAVAVVCAAAEGELEKIHTMKRTMMSPADTPRMTRLMSACLRVEAKGKYGKGRWSDRGSDSGLRRGLRSELASAPGRVNGFMGAVGSLVGAIRGFTGASGSFEGAMGGFMGAVGSLVGAVGVVSGSGARPKV